MQRDGGVQVEEIHRAVEQMVLDGLAVRHQRVGGAIELHRPQGLKVHPQHLTEGATFAEPAPGGALRPRLGHARDDRTDGGGAQRGPNPQLLEPRTRPELVHRPQRDMLHPDRARANELQRIDVDELDVAPVDRRARGGADALSGEQLGGDAVRVRLQCRGAIGRQRELSGQKLVDARGQCRPIVLGDIEVPAEIEQGTLADLVADAFRAHEAVGKADLTDDGRAGLGTPDEHRVQGSGRRT